MIETGKNAIVVSFVMMPNPKRIGMLKAKSGLGASSQHINNKHVEKIKKAARGSVLPATQLTASTFKGWRANMRAASTGMNGLLAGKWSEIFLEIK